MFSLSDLFVCVEGFDEIKIINLNVFVVCLA